MTVLDASAVLALLHDEPGAEVVAEALASARLGAANLAEVIGKLVDAEVDVSRVRGLLNAAGVVIEPVNAGPACATRVKGYRWGPSQVTGLPLASRGLLRRRCRASASHGSVIGQIRRARRETLLTPYFALALSACSDRNR
jgi:PIN domain nuclease of toxin-antitoxin system